MFHVKHFLITESFYTNVSRETFVDLLSLRSSLFHVKHFHVFIPISHVTRFIYPSVKRILIHFEYPDCKNKELYLSIELLNYVY